MLAQQQNPQNIVFKVLDSVPGQFWYLCGIGAILASLVLQLSGRKNGADFVGKWPPTFFAIGLYHKLVRPGQENAAAGAKETLGQAQDVARAV